MNNRQPHLTFIYDRRKQASSTKKASVELRITHNYKQKYISTGIMLYPNQWKNGKITNCPDILQISQTLDKILTDVRQILLDMMREGTINLDLIPIRMHKQRETTLTFVEYCRERIKTRQYGKAKGTIKHYNTFFTVFESWGQIISFEDINDFNIIAFDKYLTSKKMIANSRWGNYHKYLNTLILDAVKEGFLNRNPYKCLSICREHSSRIERYLTPEEFRKIKYTTMPTWSLEKVRDTFIFQTYTCMSYSDLRNFDSRKVQESRKMKVYFGHRVKTSKPFTIPILSPAWDILMKYEGKLPLISNVKYNEYLKLVAQAAGIDKPVSSHWARPTGATMLINEGVEMHIVSKICGHSSTKITEQVYAKLLDETIIDAVENLDI